MQFFRLLIPMVLLFIVCPLPAAIEWQNDYAKVHSQSQQENKPVLLFFNGSDWAGCAMKMKHEILDAPEFQEKIGIQFICMEVDFPKHSLLSKELVDQNQELKNRFKIEEFPSLLLIDAQERVIAGVGYLPESGSQLAEDLLLMVDQDAQLMSGLQQLDTSPTQLKKLYQLAQELDCQSTIEQILEAGLKTEDPYFFLEKYRFLVEKGEMKSEEAAHLRQKLILNHEHEPVNGQTISFTLALIDFQELSQKSDEPEIAAQPLMEYLIHFGKEDPRNIWRIEMMIAQLYLDADQWEESLRHAEKAYQAAPEAMHAEISHSLDYIRSSFQLR